MNKETSKRKNMKKNNKNTNLKENNKSKAKKEVKDDEYEYKFSIFRFIFNTIKLTIAFIIIIGCLCAGLVAGTVYSYIRTSQTLVPEDLKIENFNSYIYDTEQNVIAELKREENRVWIDYEEIPQNLIDAYVSIEDKRFFEHNGVDLERTLAATVNYFKKIVNKDTKVFGGSTITQQLVKNLTGNMDDTIKRKIQEQVQAIQLEKGLTKEEILTRYLNTVPMGGNFYGIETAAKGYFDKDVRDLSLSECASLAGITNWPVRYMPISEKTINSNIERRNTILLEILNQGKISQSEHDLAVMEKINFVYNPQAGKVTKTSIQTYFVDEVIKSVKNDLMQTYGYSEQTALDIIYNQGITIHTTMEPNVQQVLDEVFLDDRFFPKTNPKTDDNPQAAMVIMEPSTGYVKGIYGGYGKKEGSVFNRATQAKRPPGSGIKPLLVYAPAIEERVITAGTVIDDVPQYMDNKNPEDIYPRNYSSKNYGLTTVREALYNSRNVIAALILRDYIGINKALEYLGKVDIERYNEQYISIAMGGFNQGMSPLEMTAAYTVFANRGVYSKPIFYTRVLNSKGNVILENKPKSKIVYSEETIYIMNSMMRDVVTRGTAYPYGIIKNKDGQIIQSAGKTGTTSDWKDKWFYGFSPYYIGVTWYGYDDNRISLNHVAGDQVNDEYLKALQIWHEVMNRIHEDKAPQDFYQQAPVNIVTRTICKDSGKLATDLCKEDSRGNRVYNEIYIKGTEPDYSDVCESHYKTIVCLDGRDELGRPMLSNITCPSETAAEMVFIKRPVDFVPLYEDTPYPLDIIYEASPEHCTLHPLPEETIDENLDNTGLIQDTDTDNQNNNIYQGIPDNAFIDD